MQVNISSVPLKIHYSFEMNNERSLHAKLLWFSSIIDKSCYVSLFVLLTLTNILLENKSNFLKKYV